MVAEVVIPPVDPLSHCLASSRGTARSGSRDIEGGIRGGSGGKGHYCVYVIVIFDSYKLE